MFTLLLAIVTQDGSTGLKPGFRLLLSKVEAFKREPSSTLPRFPYKVTISIISKKWLKRVEIGRD